MAPRDDAVAASLRSPFERRSDMGQSILAPARPPPYGGDDKGEVRRRPGFSARRALPRSLRGFPSADSSASGAWSEECGTPVGKEEMIDGGSQVWDLAMQRMSVIAGLVEGGVEDGADAHGADAHGAEESSVAVWVAVTPDAPDAPMPFPPSLDRSFSIASSVDVQSIDDVPYPVKLSPTHSTDANRLLHRTGLTVDEKNTSGIDNNGPFYIASDEARVIDGSRKPRRRRRPFRRTDPDDIPVIHFDDIGDEDKPARRFLRHLLPRSAKILPSPPLSPLPIDDDEDDDNRKDGIDDDVYSLTKEGSRVTEEADSSSQSSNVSDTCPPFGPTDIETVTSRFSGTTIASGSSVATSSGGCLVGTLSRGFIADPIRDSLFARDINTCGSLTSLPVIELDRARIPQPTVPAPPVPAVTSDAVLPVGSGPVLWPRKFLEPRRHSLCGDSVPAPHMRRRRSYMDYIHRDGGGLLSARFLSDKGPVAVHSEATWETVDGDELLDAPPQQERKEDRIDNCTDNCVKRIGTPTRGRRRRRVFSFMGHVR